MGRLVAANTRPAPQIGNGDFRLPNRRDILGLAAAASALLAGGSRAFAGGGGTPSARLETRLFNFKTDVSAESAAAVIGRLKGGAAAAGLNGFMIGRNAIAQQFPTRFEWIYMAQRRPMGAARTDVGGDSGFKTIQHELALLCRDQAICNLNCPLPDGYGGAPGVGLRHTIMFSFKPEATAEARTRNVEDIRAMGTLPMVQNYLVEPGDPSVPGPDQMQWQVIGDFATEADCRAYASAPVHLAIRQDFTANTSRVAFLDVRL